MPLEIYNSSMSRSCNFPLIVSNLPTAHTILGLFWTTNDPSLLIFRSWLFPQVSHRCWFNPSSSQDRITPLCSWQRSGSFPVCRKKPAKINRSQHTYPLLKDTNLPEGTTETTLCTTLALNLGTGFDTTHEPSKYKRNLDKDFSLFLHTGDGINFCCK